MVLNTNKIWSDYDAVELYPSAHKAWSDNAWMLNFPAPRLYECGRIAGRPVWANENFKRKPIIAGRKGHEVTRVSSVIVNAPADIIDELWWRKHDKRAKWDKRTCDECELVQRTGQGDDMISVYWFSSKPKPFISKRDFFYTFVKRVEKNATYYFGGSFAKAEKARRKKGKFVRAHLQAILRVDCATSEKCRVTYLLRCAPHGSLYKRIIDMAANELAYTLFDLKARAEKDYKLLKQQNLRGKL